MCVSVWLFCMVHRQISKVSIENLTSLDMFLVCLQYSGSSCAPILVFYYLSSMNFMPRRRLVEECQKLKQ
jgi:hypothetical protein